MIMGNYDIFCWDYLQKVDLSSKTVIDVGAHVGYYSMCFSRLVGKYGKVYAFEPNTANVERMQINLKKNKQIITNIWVEPLAISSYVGKSKFCFSTDVDGQNSRGGYLKGSHKPLSQKVYEKAKFTSKEIDVTTIDSFVKGNDIKNIELIKVDVEGAEHFVVQGAKETLSNFSPILLIEVHSVVAMLELIRELVNLNYGVNLLKDDSSSRCFISAEKHKL
jgi:FkbM family methyltransferase